MRDLRLGALSHGVNQAEAAGAIQEASGSVDPSCSDLSRMFPTTMNQSARRILMRFGDKQVLGRILSMAKAGELPNLEEKLAEIHDEAQIQKIKKQRVQCFLSKYHSN